jgi:hypothetical protein
MSKRLFLVITLFAAALAAPASLWTFSGTAGAVFAGADIGSDPGGPLTHIFIGENFSCQVAHTDDSAYEMYPSDDESGDCSTVVLVNGTTYGYSSFAGTDFTPVSQSAVTGTGTSGDPFTVTTVGEAGEEGITVTETDSYVIGDEFYRTDVQVTNTGAEAATVRIYRGADCYLGGSDLGYGYADPIGKVVACTENINNSPHGRIEEWTPITPADHYYEAHYSDVEDAADAGTELPDTCICTTHEDNGAALSWNRTIGAGQSDTVSHFTTFDPLGVGAPTPTPAAAHATATPHSCLPGMPPSYSCGGQQGGGVPSNRATATPVATTPTPAPAVTVTAVAPTTAPAPTNTPVAPSGGREGVITGPNTGSGPGDGGPTRSAYLIGAAMFLAGASMAGAAVRRTKHR